MSNANSTADRTIEILMMYEEERPVMTAVEIAARLGAPRSTTYRYIASLRSCGLLVEADEGGYRLGQRIFTLAHIARQGFSILEAAKPTLQHLLETTGETVLLTHRRGRQLSVLECLESPQAIRISYQRGYGLSPATASSKVFLAYDDPGRTRVELRRRKLERYTGHTIVDPERLARHLEEVRRAGFAVNRNEADEGVTAVAAPVWDREGSVRYALSVVSPSFRTDAARIKSLSMQVKAAAAAISRINGANEDVPRSERAVAAAPASHRRQRLPAKPRAR